MKEMNNLHKDELKDMPKDELKEELNNLNKKPEKTTWRNLWYSSLDEVVSLMVGCSFMAVSVFLLNPKNEPFILFIIGVILLVSGAELIRISGKLNERHALREVVNQCKDALKQLVAGNKYGNELNDQLLTELKRLQSLPDGALYKGDRKDSESKDSK